MRKTISLLAALALSGATAAYAADLSVPAEAAAPDPKPATVDTAQPLEELSVVELAQSRADLSTFIQAVNAAELGETLAGTGPYTIFAPSNAAFEALPDGTVEGWLNPANKAALTETLTYHVVAGKISASDIPDGDTDVPTLNGGTIKVSKQGDVITVNGAQVATADLVAQNGVIHVIDGVLAPEAATN